MTTRVRRRKIAAVVTTFAVVGWVALSACSNAAEGERCQTANFNDDCQNGLICLAAAQVNPNYNSSDRCCPPDRSQATHPACTLLQNPVAGDSAPPPDTGPVTPTDSGNTDTGTDTGTDSGADGDAGDLDAADADGG